MDDYGTKRFRRTVIILLSLVLLTNCIIITGFLSYIGIGIGWGGFNLFSHDKPRENDIVIAGEYKILSTENISDAYISGDYDSLNSQDRETLDMAISVIDKVITPSMTDLEKEKAIYDYLTHLTPSDDPLAVVHTETDEYTPHGVLAGGSAVCVGYATTFRLFMQMLGIDCMVCHNSELGHSWDMVKFDEEWYHVDCYMGANSGNYQYFNVPDSVIFTYEQWNTDFFPEATGLKYNYAINNSYTQVEAAEDAPKIIWKNIKKGINAFALYFGPNFDPYGENDISLLLEVTNEYIGRQDGFKDSYGQYDWVYGENGYILLYYLYTYSEEPIDPFDPAYQDVYDIVEEAFN